MNGQQLPPGVLFFARLAAIALAGQGVCACGGSIAAEPSDSGARSSDGGEDSRSIDTPTDASPAEASPAEASPAEASPADDASPTDASPPDDGTATTPDAPWQWDALADGGAEPPGDCRVPWLDQLCLSRYGSPTSSAFRCAPPDASGSSCMLYPSPPSWPSSLWCCAADADAMPPPVVDGCTPIHYPIVDATGSCPPIEGPGLIWVTNNPYGTTGCSNGCCVVSISGIAACEVCEEEFTCSCLHDQHVIPNLSYPGTCNDGFPPVLYFD
jgi:hypothetical protein